MMKSRRLLLVISVVLLATLVLAGAVSAGATRTYFTGTEVQIGGADPLQYWEAGRTTHIRGLTSIYLENSSDPRVSGQNTVLVNINFHPARGGTVGQFWGTYKLENDGGYWAGTFQGSISPDGSSSYRAHGQGGGGYEGLKVFISAETPVGQPGSSTGYILDPGQ